MLRPHVRTGGADMGRRSAQVPHGGEPALEVGEAPGEALAAAVGATREELETALSLATLNPARALELPHKGRIQAGADGDILLMRREDLSLDTVLSMGRVMMKHGEIQVRGTYE